MRSIDQYCLAMDVAKPVTIKCALNHSVTCMGDFSKDSTNAQSYMLPKE